MTNGRLQFEYNKGRFPRPTLRSDRPAPFRILVLGDVTGREPARRDTPFAQRKPTQIDVDNFDQVFAGFAPRLDLLLEETPLAIEFQHLNDFHPDSLFQRLGPFTSLRKLRADLQDPSRFAAAAASFRRSPANDADSAPSETLSADADIERLLGRRPETKPGSGALMLDQWLKHLVTPYIVSDTGHDQQRFVAALDAAIAGQMRRVLHHPSFQALEARWRGIARLVTGLQLGETVQVFLLDASQEELEEDITGAGGDLTRSAIYQHLCGSETETESSDGLRWALFVGDYTFGPSVNEVTLLTTLGAMAAQAGAPLLAGARTDVLGCTGVDSLSAPESWRAPDPDVEARWQALRASVGAPWIGLALPRVLARLPYGAKSDPIESFEFEELPASRDHEAYLWGNPAFALALLAAQAFEEDEWAMDLDRWLNVTDLPSHAYRDEGETKLQPCAEVLLTERSGETSLLHGVMPLLSYRNQNVARLLRWQSLAYPPRALQWVGAIR